MKPKPCFPPPNLLRRTDEGQYSISYREGVRLVLAAGRMPSLLQRYVLVLAGSIALEGQPIRCSGFKPGVTLRLQMAERVSADDVDAEQIVRDAWTQTHPRFMRWYAEADDQPHLTVQAADVISQFARDADWQLRPGVMQIDLLRDR